MGRGLALTSRPLFSRSLDVGAVDVAALQVKTVIPSLSSFASHLADEYVAQANLNAGRAAESRHLIVAVTSHALEWSESAQPAHQLESVHQFLGHTQVLWSKHLRPDAWQLDIISWLTTEAPIADAMRIA